MFWSAADRWVGIEEYIPEFLEFAQHAPSAIIKFTRFYLPQFQWAFRLGGRKDHHSKYQYTYESCKSTAIKGYVTTEVLIALFTDPSAVIVWGIPPSVYEIILIPFGCCWRGTILALCEFIPCPILIERLGGTTS